MQSNWEGMLTTRTTCERTRGESETMSNICVILGKICVTIREVYEIMRMTCLTYRGNVPYDERNVEKLR